MLKKIMLFTSLFILILTPTSFANDDLNKNAQSFIERHDKQSVQKEKVKNAFITNINNQPYFFPKDLNIVSLGDSLTEGVGDESKNSGYVGRIEDNLDNEIEIDNFGISGYRSDQLLKLIEKPDVQLSLLEADIVLMTIGANDMMKIFKRDLTNLEVEPFFDELIEFEKRLTDIFTNIHSVNPQTKIYLIGFYDPFTEFFPEVEELTYISSSWNAGTAMITNQFDYTYYIPTNQLFEGNVAAYLAEDQFHPNKKGYTEITAEVIEHITKEVDDAYDTK